MFIIFNLNYCDSSKKIEIEHLNQDVLDYFYDEYLGSEDCEIDCDVSGVENIIFDFSDEEDFNYIITILCKELNISIPQFKDWI